MMKTTCSIVEGSPERAGIAAGAALRDAARATSGPAPANRSRLFSATAVVNPASCAAFGIGITATDPRLACTYRFEGASRQPDPGPSSEVTAMCRPLGSSAIPFGYQPGGD